MEIPENEVSKLREMLNSPDWDIKYLSCTIIENSNWFRETPIMFQNVIRTINSGEYWIKFPVFRYVYGALGLIGSKLEKTVTEKGVAVIVFIYNRCKRRVCQKK